MGESEKKNKKGSNPQDTGRNNARVEIIVRLVLGLVVDRKHESWSDAKETKGPEGT
jgi:hypothetical protein